MFLGAPRPRPGEAMRSTGISMDTSAPVVVLSPHHHGALGIFRSLGVLGVPDGTGGSTWTVDSVGVAAVAAPELVVAASDFSREAVI